MDYTDIIKSELASGRSWEEIANNFAENMNTVHKAELQEEEKVVAVKDALKNFYGGSMDKVIDEWKNEDVRNVLENFQELYKLFDNLTFPLK